MLLQWTRQAIPQLKTTSDGRVLPRISKNERQSVKCGSNEDQAGNQDVVLLSVCAVISHCETGVVVLPPVRNHRILN